MDKTIMLRPHHFGEIYEIFAGWLSTKSSEKYIDSLIKRKIDFFVPMMTFLSFSKRDRTAYVIPDAYCLIRNRLLVLTASVLKSLK